MAKMTRYNFMEEPAEVDRWKAVAASEGADLSTWIRRVCRAAAKEAEAANPPEKKRDAR